MDAKLRLSYLFSRRWLQFRMRTLLGFMIVCGLVSKFGGQVNEYYAEQNALAQLRTFGGSWVSESSLPIFL
jgi:hypothetical protein